MARAAHGVRGVSAHDRITEHVRLRAAMTDVETAAKEGGISALRRAFGELALALFDHMAREELTPGIASIARLHTEHAEQRAMVRAALEDLAADARPFAEIVDEIAWLLGVLRRDIDEEERCVLVPASTPTARPPTMCRDLMRSPLLVVHEQDTARTAALTMLEGNVGFVVVVDGAGQPTGVLTDRDLAIRLVAESGASDARVATLMSRQVLTCVETEAVDVAAREMGKHKKSRIVCVDEAGRARGVVSVTDIARHDAPRASRAGELLQRIAEREVRRR